MKRLLLFLAILLILLGLTFVVSLLLFPAWRAQANWTPSLIVVIVAGGLIILAAAVISKAVSTLLLNRDALEWIEYLTGDKYRSIRRSLREITQSELDKEQKSRRYIPAVFVETTEVKEKLRYFAEPQVFVRKIIEDTNRGLRASYIVNALRHTHFPVKLAELPVPRLRDRDRRATRKAVDKLSRLLKQQQSLTDILIKNDGAGLRPEHMSSIPAEFSHIHDYTRWNLQYYWSFERLIETAQADLSLLTSRLLVIKSVAGHGKTNLLCDFVDTFLRRKGHACLYVPTRQLDYLGKDETIEERLAKVLFGDSGFTFLDIQRLLRLDPTIGFLFIVIDGINEHQDMPLLCTALEQFIQRCAHHNIKVILTCRAEYFNERFGSLAHLPDATILDMDEPRYTRQVPTVHVTALVSRYLSEFSVQLDADSIAPEIRQIFYEDKLLLRIFCEAYEGQRPVDYLDNLHKLEMFNAYHARVSQSIPGLDACLTEIISWMIARDQFSNVPISALSAPAVDVLHAIIHENVIIRQDLIAVPGVAFGNVEVINFVYDEFRDFLVASHVLTAWNENAAASKERLERFTQSPHRVAEGLQKYLVLWAIRYDNRGLIEHFRTLPWFGLEFIRAVMDTPDRYVADWSVATLRDLFCADEDCTLQILFSLSRRRNDTLHAKLNIHLVLAWIISLDEDAYMTALSGALNKQYDFSTSYVSHLCHLAVTAYNRSSESVSSREALLHLLGQLSAVEDRSFGETRDYGFGKYPAQDAILQISTTAGRRAVRASVTTALERASLEQVRQQLRDILPALDEE